MAGQRFPMKLGHQLKWGCQPIWKSFPENCVKIKTIDTGRQEAHPPKALNKTKLIVTGVLHLVLA